MKGILWIARISATSLMLAGAVGFVAVVAAPDMAIAKNGNGNGNGGGNGNSAGKGADKSKGNSFKSSKSGGSTKAKKGGKKPFKLKLGSKSTGSKSKKGGLNLDAAGKKIKGFAATVDAAITGKKKPKNTVQKVKPTKVSTTVIDEEELPPNHHGKIASELKGLNAAHASQTALMNAAPNSMPGKLYSYQQAILEYSDTAQNVVDAQAEVDDLAKKSPSDEEFKPTDEQIAQNPDASEEELAQKNYDQAVEDANKKLADAQDAADNIETSPDEALDTLTGGRELSDDALTELHRLLGLPDPIDDDASIDDDAVAAADAVVDDDDDLYKSQNLISAAAD